MKARKFRTFPHCIEICMFMSCTSLWLTSEISFFKRFDSKLPKHYMHKSHVIAWKWNSPVIPKITRNNPPIFSPNFYECLLKVLLLTLSNIWKILNVVLSKSFWNLFSVSTITIPTVTQWSKVNPKKCHLEKPHFCTVYLKG